MIKVIYISSINIESEELMLMEFMKLDFLMNRDSLTFKHEAFPEISFQMELLLLQIQ